MPDENRQGALRVKQRLEVQFWHDSPPTAAFVEDISETGMFVDTNQPLPKGSNVEFSFQIPGIDPETPLRGAGTVVWSDPTGMGVRFSDLSETDRQRIRFFVGAVFFNQPPELPPSE